MNAPERMALRAVKLRKVYGSTCWCLRPASSTCSSFRWASTLPHWMQWVAHALPPAYVFEGMRDLLHGGGFPAALLMQGVAIAAAELLLAAYYYGRVYRHAVRTGLLARYSAESAA